MSKVKILALCSHPDILPVVVRLVNSNPDWQATGAETEEQAIELFEESPFDIVLLGSGMDELSENRLRPVFFAINPTVRFVQHYGGGSGLLACEIYEALK